MKDLMLDIETLGCGEYSPIIQVGACYFNRENGEIGKEFLISIDLVDAVNYGKPDGDTIRWWMSQDPNVIKQVINGTSKLKVALENFKVFAEAAECIWSHSTFDFVIVTNAMKILGLKGLGYRRGRDIRTLVDLAGSQKDDVAPNDNAHNALSDCKHQVAYVVKALNKINDSRKEPTQ